MHGQHFTAHVLALPALKSMMIPSKSSVASCEFLLFLKIISSKSTEILGIIIKNRSNFFKKCIFFLYLGYPFRP